MSRAALGDVAVLAAVLVPLALAAAVPLVSRMPRAWRRVVVGCAPLAALPAAVVATGALGAADARYGALLFGVRLGYGDAVSRAFAPFTAFLWLAAGVYAATYVGRSPRSARFWVYWLLTLAGNVGAVFARDAAGFYAFYVLMTFAAYGLIVHEGSDEARRAGRVYVVMALFGEVLLMAALAGTVGASVDLDLAEAPRAIAAHGLRGALVALFLVGFGVKAGALLLHVWLPLAHPVAPTPASAILSGALIAGGLLGLLRFLPLGEAALPAHGATTLAFGLAAAFFGVAVGLTQRDPKTILAYSSISQMGLVTAAVGVGLAAPEVGPVALGAALYYAAHHGLAKGALFLGVGVARESGAGLSRPLVALGLLLSALDLAGAPLSSGAMAKHELKKAVERSPFAADALPALLGAAAVGTTLLMAWFLFRTAAEAASKEPRVPRAGLFVPWALLLALDALALLAPSAPSGSLALLVQPGEVASAAWPVALGVSIALVASKLAARLGGAPKAVPAGDVLVVYERTAGALGRLARAADARWARLQDALVRALLASGEGVARAAARTIDAAERGLARFGTIGLVFVLLALALAATRMVPMR